MGLNSPDANIFEESFCNIIKSEDVDTDHFMYSLIVQIDDIFSIEKFFIPVKKKELILRYRWGLIDGNIHSIEKTCEKYSIQVPYYVEQENLLLRQLGFILGKKECSSDEYIQMEIDSAEIRAIVDAFGKTR